MRTTIRAFSTSLMCAGILAGTFAGSVSGQTVRDIDALERIGAKEAGVKPPSQAENHTKLTAADALRVRMLEIESGERSFANRPPERIEIIQGAPLDEREQIVHILSRMAFGARPGEIDELMKQGGWLSWIEPQLDPDTISDSKLDTMVAEKYPWTKMSLQQMMIKYPIPENYENQPQLRSELPQSVVLRAALSNRQFKEVMCEFWRNHFCINQPEGNAPKRSYTACAYEENVIRKHAFGKFEQMLLASATHPGMLEYLDNYVSRKGAWNENYARELMELHTLGADRFYNEQDVLELSLTLTGWTFSADTLSYYFKSEWHDGAAHKVLGKKLPPGKEGGEFALLMLARHPGTARYISEKLCKYLVNDNPPKSLVTKVTNTFTSSKGDLKKVYREIVMSEEFMNRLNYKAKFKTPFEFTISALRATGADITDLASTTDNVMQMGQQIYGCDDPTGYYDYAEAWLDAGVLTKRWNYAYGLMGNKVRGVTVDPKLVDRYKADKPADIRAKVLKDFIGSDVGDHEDKLLMKLAEKGDIARMIAITVGSPSFQQQ
jgi:uncharacterized protein (DUF1800 family)